MKIMNRENSPPRLKKKIFYLKKLLFIGFAFFFFLSLASLNGQNELTVQLRFYQGWRSVAQEPLTVVTSSYLNPVLTANILSAVEPAEEKKQIQRVFNLLEVRLLTETIFTWAQPLQTKTCHLRFDSWEMAVSLTPQTIFYSSESKAKIQIISMREINQFRVSVSEMVDSGSSNPLLETEITIPTKKIVILGFESRDGIPYFLTLQVSRPPVSSPEKGKVKGVEGGVEGGVVGGVVSPTKAVRAVGDIKPPKLIKKVEPIYPEVAREAGVEGIVILEAETDEKGNVVRVQVLRSIPLLDQAAIDAVKQWKYEPALINGQPTGIIFTVTVSFLLKK